MEQVGRKCKLERHRQHGEDATCEETLLGMRSARENATSVFESRAKAASSLAALAWRCQPRDRVTADPSKSVCLCALCDMCGFHPLQLECVALFWHSVICGRMHARP